MTLYDYDNYKKVQLSKLKSLNSHDELELLKQYLIELDQRITQLEEDLTKAEYIIRSLELDNDHFNGLLDQSQKDIIDARNS